MSDRNYRRVNRALGKNPTLGGIPLSIVFPGLFAFSTAAVLRLVFGLTWLQVALFGIWLTASWWAATGGNNFKFLSQFSRWFLPRWIRGVMTSQPISSRGKQKRDRGAKGKGQSRKLGVPFEESLDLVTMVHFAIGGREVGAYLLKSGSQYQLVFGVDCQGIHPILTETEIIATLEQLEAGLKNLPQNESLTIHFSIFADDTARQEELSVLTEQTESDSLKCLLTAERARIQQIKRDGIRKPSSLKLFCTYTIRQGNSQGQDWLGRALGWLERFSKRLNGQIAEFNNRHLEATLREAFSEGFERWERLFSTMGLKVRPFSSTELWSEIWYRFNRTQPVAIPQSLILDEQGLRELVHSRLDIKTHLTRDGVPQAGKSWVKVGGKYLAALTFIDKPSAINLHYLYERLSRDGVKDVEVFCQISSADTTSSQILLELLTKQASYNAERAGTQHNVDVGSEMQIQEAVEAQQQIVAGAKPVYCSVVFLIHRPTRRELDAACKQFESYFPRPAWVARETQLSWFIWRQTLPIVCDRLMVFAAGVFDQRQLYLSSEIAGLMPLLKQRLCDSRGLELIAEGGEPLFIDLFERHRNLIVLATTRGGKSVLIAAVLLQGLARTIPVVVIDFPGADGRSTFSDYTPFLNGEYFDLSTAQNNLFELPDVRHLSPEQQRERLSDYRDFLLSALMTIIVGRETGSSIAQRIRDVLTLALDVFFKDEAIQKRSYEAFRDGFNSEAWNAMPTIKEFLHLCKPEHLGLGARPSRETEDVLDKIHLRLRSWLKSRVGKALSSPSSFRTDSHLLVFALRGLSNNEDAAVLALSAYSAALRRALSHEASIFFIDEAPILFEFDEISSLIGRLCANGAKQGIRVILSGQDPDTIATSAAGTKILQNINTHLVGRIQPSAIDSFERIFRYPPELISRNASESFFPNSQGIYSNWLLDDNGTFYHCRFYPSLILLALTANNPDEKSARAKVMECFDDQYEGIAQFAKLLKFSVQSGTPLKTVVIEWLETRHHL